MKKVSISLIIIGISIMFLSNSRELDKHVEPLPVPAPIKIMSLEQMSVEVEEIEIPEQVVEKKPSPLLTPAPRPKPKKVQVKGAVDSKVNIHIINTYRNNAGINSVTLDNRLVQSARYKADQLSRENKEWNLSLHNGYEAIINRFYPGATFWGENIARNFHSNNQSMIYKSWFNSSIHRAVLLHKRARHFGYACVNNYCVLHIANN